MFDGLINALVNFGQLFMFWAVVDEYERGVLLRFGRFKREVEPGFHWCWPLAVDRVICDNVVTRTHKLGSQTLTTKDGRTVSITAMVTANIRHIRKALLEVESMDHALRDSCCAAVCEHVAAHDWDDLRRDVRTDTLSKACRAQAFRYGIEIERVQLKDISLSRVLHIHMDTKPNPTSEVL